VKEQLNILLHGKYYLESGERELFEMIKVRIKELVEEILHLDVIIESMEDDFDYPNLESTEYD
jgi:hypothetical protein